MQLFKFIGICLFIFTCQVSLAREPYPFTSKEQAQQFQNITTEVRCIVCQNQSLAESDAPLAKDLRNKIYQLILAKKSDSQIKTYLTNRYGEFILLRPLWTKTNFLLWTLPFLAIMALFLFLIRKVKRTL